MNWKEFFVPSKEKIIVTILLILIIYFSAPYIVGKNILAIIYLPIIAVAFLFTTCGGDLCTTPIEIMPVVMLIYSYFLSCLIIFIYNKYRGKKR